jgi:hypothetical protein
MAELSKMLKKPHHSEPKRMLADDKIIRYASGYIPLMIVAAQNS